MLTFFGRLHPALVHLPIGVLVIAFLLQYAYRKEGKRTVISLLLYLGWVAVLVATITGWVHAQEGEYAEAAVDRHRWPAYILLAGLTTLLFFHYKSAINSLYNKIYHAMLWATMILLVVTGHFGGEMTHGGPGLVSDSGRKTKQGQEVAAGEEDLQEKIKPAKPVDTAILSKVRKAGFVVRELAKSSNWYEASAIQTPALDDEGAMVLSDMSENLVWLDLQGTAISDKTLQLVAKLQALEHLNLKGTQVTNSGIKLIAALPKLTRLNLVSTKVDDGVLEVLSNTKSLQRIYVWQTAVSKNALDPFIKAHPEIKIDNGAETNISAHK